jgi:hypothetical protein
MAETVTQITQPAPFIEAAGKTYLTELQQAIGGFKQADLSQTMGPQFTAGQDPLQLQAQQAASLLVLGGYQPYLQSAAASNRTNCISSLYVSISTRCYKFNFTRI